MKGLLSSLAALFHELVKTPGRGGTAAIGLVPGARPWSREASWAHDADVAGWHASRAGIGNGLRLYAPVYYFGAAHNARSNSSNSPSLMTLGRRRAPRELYRGGELHPNRVRRMMHDINETY